MNTYVCGIATLTPLNMLTSKSLANSDRWNDDGVFNRDVIDLAMMNPSLPAYFCSPFAGVSDAHQSRFSTYRPVLFC
jgi:hypothetical protein